MSDIDGDAKPRPRTIVIVMRDGNNFDVHEGDRSSGQLCWDEMLGQVASLTHPSINAPRYRMPTTREAVEAELARKEHFAVMNRPTCFVEV